MKYILNLSIAVSLALFVPQSALACGSYQPMEAADYAFADVIFEGEVKSVFPKFRYSKYQKRDQIVEANILFDVDRVLRGDIAESEILVGYELHTFGAPKSVEAFVEQFGQHVRVGLVTPELHDKHCREKMVEFTNGGTGEKTQKPRLVCDFYYPQRNRAAEIPFIHTVACGNQFIFDTSKPIVLRNVGIGSYNSKFVELFRKYPDWFTPELTEGSPVMDRLLEEGLEIFQINDRTAGKTDADREATIGWVTDEVRRELFIFANLSETDPELRERFLRDDLSDISR